MRFKPEIVQTLPRVQMNEQNLLSVVNTIYDSYNTLFARLFKIEPSVTILATEDGQLYIA